MKDIIIKISVNKGVAETRISCNGVRISSSVDGDTDEIAVLKAISAMGSHTLDLFEDLN